VTLDDHEGQDKGFLWIFDDFWLRHTFQEQTAPKSLQIDQYNLRLKFSTINVDLKGLSLDSVGPKWFTHDGIKDGHSIKSRYITAIGCARPVTPFGECK